MGYDHKGSPEKGRERLDKISESINAKFGTHVTLPLKKAAITRVLRLPFGILEIDWRVNGGIPINRTTRIWGKPSSLKSTACLRLIRNAQHFCRHCKLPVVTDPNTNRRNCACPDPRWTLMDPGQFGMLSKTHYGGSFDIQYGRLPKGSTKKGSGFAVLSAKNDAGKKAHIEFRHTDRCEPFRCLLIDTERSTDEDWAVANGVDTELLLLMGGNWAEQVLDLTEEVILTNEVDLVVLDSLDMLTPGDTLQKAISQTKRIADKARIMTETMQKWMSASSAGGLLNRYAPTIVIVAQVRAKDIGKPWASLKPSGGWAVGHGISLDVKLEPHKYEYKGSSALFGTFGCMIAKSKVGGFPRSSGKFRFWLRPGKGRLVGDTEDLEIVMEHAETMGLIVKTAQMYKLESEFIANSGHIYIKTKKAMKQFLEEHVSVYLDLRNRVLSHLIGEDISITLPSEKIAAEEKKTAKKKTMLTVEQAKAKKATKKGPEDTNLDDLLSFVE